MAIPNRLTTYSVGTMVTGSKIRNLLIYEIKLMYFLTHFQNKSFFSLEMLKRDR